MRLTSITVADFKRLKSAHLDLPVNGLVVIGGRNDAGKSSALDAVEAAIGGKRHTPKRPVREGADAAEVQLSLTRDDGTPAYDVVRRITAGGTHSLVITDHAGRRTHSPQQLLNGMVGDRFIDPASFLSAKPADQRDRLLSTVPGLAEELARLSVLRQQWFDERRDVNRDLKRARAVVDSIGELPATQERKSAVTLTKQLQALQSDQHRQHQDKAQAEALRNRLTGEHAERRRIDARMDALDAELKTLGADALAIAEVIDRTNGQLKAAEAAIAAHEPVDCFALEFELEGIDEHNRQCEAAATVARRHAEASDEARTLADQSAALSDRLLAADAAKADAVDGVTMPVPGLAVDEDGVTLDGLPLSQASQSGRLRVALGVAAALRSELRAVWVRDGAFLDDESMADLERWADERDVVVLVERVGTHDPGCIEIVDGEVRA